MRAWLAVWGVLLLGLALLITGGALMWTEPPLLDAHVAGVHKLHYEFDAALIVTGLLLLVPAQLADGIGKVANAIATAIATFWRAKSGGA